MFALPQVDNFRRQFDHLDAGGQGRPPGPNLGQATSLPRERVREFQHEAARYMQGQQVRGATTCEPARCFDQRIADAAEDHLRTLVPSPGTSSVLDLAR